MTPKRARAEGRSKRSPTRPRPQLRDLEPAEDRPPSKPGARDDCGQNDGAVPIDIQRDEDARLRRRYGDFTTKSTDLLMNRDGYVLLGDESAHSNPLDVPDSGG